MCLSVCLSVRLSLARVNDQVIVISLHIFYTFCLVVGYEAGSLVGYGPLLMTAAYMYVYRHRSEEERDRKANDILHLVPSKRSN